MLATDIDLVAIPEAAGGAAMAVIGKDPNTSRTTQSASAISYIETNKTWAGRFDTINLAQVPSFLVISAPRINSTYSAGQSGNNAIRNLSANLFIKSLKITVNAAQGRWYRDLGTQVLPARAHQVAQGVLPV